jgi:cytochrome c oxidase subunit 4
MIGLLNFGSLMCGLIAWILPVINLIRYKEHDNRNWVALSIMSISACAISLYFQVLYNNHLVNISDWSALMDITDAMVFVATVLLIVTIILNVITLLVYRNRTAK